MNDNQIKRRQKNGAYARLGLFMALASWFGSGYANMVYSTKLAGRHFNNRTKGGFGSKRAGFKLTKKMARTQTAVRLKGPKVPT